MARVSKEALESRAREAEAQAYILELGMHCALANEIKWIASENIKADDDGPACLYQFGVARLGSPNGGLFFTRFDCPGQNQSFHVVYLDEVLSECRRNPSSEFAQIRVHALDTAVTMRDKAIKQ